MNDRGVAGRFGYAVIMNAGARKIGECGGDLRVGVDRARGGQPAPRALLPPVEIGLEQVGGARRRQDEDEGNDEQPGIKMPAPDRAIGGACLWRRCFGGRHHVKRTPPNTARPVPGLKISEPALASPAMATVAI